MASSKVILIKKDAKKKINDIFEFFETNVPETESLEESLYEVQKEYKNN